MSLSDSVRMALKKAGKNHTDLIRIWGNSKSAMSNKFRLERWSGDDLLRVAEFTGGRLAFIYSDGQQILIDPEPVKKTRPDPTLGNGPGSGEPEQN